MWILSSYAILSHPNHKIFENIIHIWFIGLTGLIIFGPVPGYHGYYYDILIPLSALAAIGLYNAYKNIKYKINKNRTCIVTSLIIITLVGLLPSYVSLIKNTYNPDIVSGINDFRIIIELSDFVKSYTSHNDKIFVWEKDNPKIGPYIYVFSGRVPPVPFTFLFPYASEENLNRVIKGLEEYNVPYVIIISSGKSVFNQKILDEYIMLHYIKVKDFGKIKTYKWLPDQKVEVYKRYTIDMSQNILKSNQVSLSIAKSPNTSILYALTSSQDNSTEILVKFNEPGWLSLLYRFRSPLDLSHQMYVLELPIKIYGEGLNTNKNILLHIDLVDSEKHWKRVTITFKDDTIFVPLTKGLFGSGIDYQSIKEIHIAIETLHNDNITLRITVKKPKIMKISI